MDSVIRFAKMDWLTFRPYRKYFLILLSPLIIIYFDNSLVVIPSVLMSAMVAAMTSCYLFSGEDKSGMTRLYAALPIHKKEVVIGRYFGGVLMGLGCILVTALLLLVDSMVTSAFSVQDVITGVNLAIGVFFVFMSFQFPILFQYGFIKAGGITMAIPTIVLVVANQIWRGAFYQAMNNLSSMTGLLLLLFGLACFAVSLWASNMIYQAKEQ